MNCKTQKPEFRMIECSISNLGKVVTGKTPSTKNSLFWEGDIPFITPKDIQKTKHIFDTERNLTFEGMKSVKNCVLPENAICVSCIGNIGYVAKTTSPAVTNQQINSIIVNDANNSDYVYYLMRSLWQRFKNYEGQSTTLSILNKRQFSEIKILIHEDKAVQTKIANVLSSLDNKIELNEKINQNLEAQAQAIFKSWFVDFEPFKNGKFIDSELGKIPEGWTVNTLSNIVYLKKGKKPKELSEIKHENYIPYLTIDALSGGRPLFCDTEKMLLAKEKDILLVMDGASSGAIFYGLDGVVASTIIKLELTNTEIREIVFAFLNYKQLDLKSHTTGSAIPHLDKDRLLSYKIALPSNGKLLRKISGTLKSLRDNIIRNRKESRRLAQLRDTLLPKLMSGEIDVSDVAV